MERKQNVNLTMDMYRSISIRQDYVWVTWKEHRRLQVEDL